jgi:small-conductance mechanosensitive channel
MDKTTAEHILFAITALIIVTVISFIVRKLLTAMIEKNSKLIGSNATRYVFLKNSITFILYSITIFWILHKIPYFNSLGSALFASAGILAAIIGFASQKAFSNIIGGIFILIFKPFRVGDVIEVSNSRKGYVEEITLRHCIIRDYENQRVIIPNSIISEETIINSSIEDEKIRKHVVFGISYDSDIDLAKKIIREHIKSTGSLQCCRKQQRLTHTPSSGSDNSRSAAPKSRRRCAGVRPGREVAAT